MFEDSKTQAVAWGNTTTLPEITVDPEKVAAAAETLRKAWAGIMTSFEVAAEALREADPIRCGGGRGPARNGNGPAVGAVLQPPAV